MKFTLLLAVVVVAALIGLNRAAGPSVDPNVGVRVVAADPIRLVLPINPDRNVIIAGISGELRSAAGAESSPALSRELEQEIASLSAAYDAQAEELSEVVIRAKATDTHVPLIALAWMPYTEGGDGRLQPAW